MKYKGQFLLREDLTDSEREELKHFEHDDITTRPDILLFPEEHKCVIIEFKSPDVELSNQIEQINNYASIIRQFSKPEFEITNFTHILSVRKLIMKRSNVATRSLNRPTTLITHIVLTKSIWRCTVKGFDVY